MRQTIAALSLCLALMAGSAYAAGTLTLRPNETVAIDGDGCDLTVASATASAVHVACGPAYDQVEGVDVCRDHDPTTWHPLVRRESDGAIACTYGHEHHDDPNAVDDIFGPPSAWYGGDQEISYPWQTSSTLGLENHAKHEGYKWTVRRDLPCRPFGGGTGCVLAFRAQAHARGDVSDATSRFHSFSLEALVERDGRRGIVRHGGWIDTGHLALLADGASTHICPPLTTNPDAFRCSGAPRREHSGANLPAPHKDHSGYMVNWYSQHLVTQVAPRLEEWGPIDYRDPAHQLLHPPSVRANNSRGRIENLAVVTTYSWFRSSVADGLVRFAGHTDRHGVPVDGCADLGPDCVPLAIEGVPPGAYSWNAVAAGLTDDPEHDVPSPATGNSLIRYPN